MAIRLVINADDLGASAPINRAIEACLRQGVVTSTTLLANGPAFDEAVELVRPYRKCSVGVHLNAMEYFPIKPTEDLRPLLAGDGRFAGRLSDVEITAALRRALVQEWCAQIDRVRAAGLRVSHLDSHYHGHTLPAMFGVLKAVVKSSGVKKIRLSKNLYSASQPPASKSLLWKKRLWNGAVRFVLDARTTDAFTEFQTFVEIGRQSEPSVHTIEVMVHPGHEQYRDETALLTGAWQKELTFTVELISYHEI